MTSYAQSSAPCLYRGVEGICYKEVIEGTGYCPDHQVEKAPRPPGRRMPKNWGHTRNTVLRRDKYTCYLCQEHATEVDHVIPHWKGGGDHLGNLKAICHDCHKHKSATEGAEASHAKLKQMRRQPRVRPTMRRSR